MNVSYQPSSAEIAKRAYELYLERGRRPGNEAEDWYRAERELIQKHQVAALRPSPAPKLPEPVPATPTAPAEPPAPVAVAAPAEPPAPVAPAAPPASAVPVPRPRGGVAKSLGLRRKRL